MPQAYAHNNKVNFLDLPRKVETSADDSIVTILNKKYYGTFDLENSVLD